MVKDNSLSRREFTSLGIKAAALTALGGLELFTSAAQARTPQQVEVVLDYQTILGNNQREDQIAQLRVLADHYGRLADFYSGGVLAIPEDALILAVKPQRLRVLVDEKFTFPFFKGPAFNGDLAKRDREALAFIIKDHGDFGQGEGFFIGGAGKDNV